MIIFLYLAIGCAAGFLSGLLGIGGGLLLVPALMMIFSAFGITTQNEVMHLSIGTSLASSIINLLISTRSHAKRNSVLWFVFYTMAPSVLIGALLIGPLIILYINSEYLKIIFGIFCFLIFIQIIFSEKHETETYTLPSKTILSLIGLFIGSLSTLLGIAGGALIGALLHFHKVNARHVVGTSAAISIIIAVSGSIGLMIVGYHQPHLPPLSTGFIYWPAFLGIVIPSFFSVPLGASLAHRLPVSILKKIFGCFVLIIGVKMI